MAAILFRGRWVNPLKRQPAYAQDIHYVITVPAYALKLAVLNHKHTECKLKG